MIFRKPEIITEYILDTDGIVIESFYVVGKQMEQIKFPLYKNSKLLKIILDNNDKNLKIEELWLEDIVENYHGKYIIPYFKLYDIDELILEELNLPYNQNIKIKLKSHNYLGNKDFNIKYSLSTDVLGNIDSYYIRNENVISIDNEKALLSKDQFNLIREIDKYEYTDFENQGLFLARVKQKAKAAKASLDDYLNQEECFLPKELDINILNHSDFNLELKPFFLDLDDNMNEKILELDNLERSISFSKGIKRQRIFFEEKQSKEFNEISKDRNIIGSDVPKFIKNPTRYLPESFEIEEFSKRVKGIKIRTYKAQPFIHCDEGHGGWFEFDTGIRLKPDVVDEFDDNNVEDAKIEIEDFTTILNKAKDDNEDFVYYNGKWIEVDLNDGEKFIEAEKKIKDSFKDGKVEYNKISYILDIFDNLENLDYSYGYISMKERYLDKTLFYYDKPKLLNADLFLYQQEGFNWLKSLKQQKLGGLLADDMGLGKTLQIIAYIAYLKQNNELGPSMIVVPKSLVDNWYSEIQKFTKEIKSVYIHLGSQRTKVKEYIEDHDIVITTYDILVRDQIILGKIDWMMIAIDEAQKIKNASTLYASAVKSMKASHTIALTGTPVENNLSELWSIVDFVQPGLLGSYLEFRKDFQKPIEANIENLDIISIKSKQLISKIEPIFLRRTKEDKLEGLPGKYYNKLECEIGNLQLTMYMNIIDEIKENKSPERTLAYLQELLMISSHPRLIDKDINISSKELIKECPKLKITLNLLGEIKNKKEKVIVFTKYKDMQSILRKTIFEEMGIWASIINGGVTQNRLDIIRNFEEVMGFNVIILSPRAAGVGLNIVGANHVIHYTREWNPAVENQATDRVYRIGQKKDVQVYYPIVTSINGVTVEMRLDELLSKKTALANEVVIPMEQLKISKEELFEGII